MKREQLKHITSKYYTKLKKLINQIIPAFESDTIHQFRVSYKKLRAFLRMISEEQAEDGEIKVSKKLNESYHIAGSIRDMYLQQQRILEATKQDLLKPLSYIALLQRKIDILQTELAKIFLKKPVTKSKKKTDASIPDEFPLSAFKKYMQNKSAAITGIVASGIFSDVIVHSIRKNLKDLLYNQKTYEIDEHDKLTLSPWNGKDELYFAALLDELGNFQDTCTAIALMKPGWLKSLHKLEQEQLEGIKKQWRKEKVNMKESLLNKLKAAFPALPGEA